MLNKINRKIKKIIYIIIIAIFVSLLYLYYIEKQINPQIYNFINLEAKRFTINIINSITNNILSKKNTNDYLIVKRNIKNEIEIVDFDTKKLNDLLKEINLKVQEKLINLEKGKFDNKYKNERYKKYKNIRYGILYEIPISKIKNNIILSNIGPTIPIKLSFKGNVKTSTKTNIKNYGINHLVINIKIKVEINEQITMPMTSKEQTIVIESPLILKVIEGKIPFYYDKNIEEQKTVSTISI